MGENTHISWADHTFNVWEGCARISEACKNCYAEARDERFHGGENWGKHAPRKLMSDGYWRQPLRWNRQAAETGVRRRVFCASLADVFEDHADDGTADVLDSQRARLWELIDQTPWLDWLLLTKRPENIARMVPESWMGDTDYPPDWPDNVWIGSTIESPAVHDRLDHLRQVPARIRFISAEPLLADISDVNLDGIAWVIVGGESGPNARPMHPEWVRALRDRCEFRMGPCEPDCVHGSIPVEGGGRACECNYPDPARFHFKQWGEWMPAQWKVEREDAETGATHAMQPNGHVHEFTHEPWSLDRSPVATAGWVGIRRVGKQAAGRTLDGRIWDEVPT